MPCILCTLLTHATYEFLFNIRIIQFKLYENYDMSHIVYNIILISLLICYILYRRNIVGDETLQQDGNFATSWRCCWRFLPSQNVITIKRTRFKRVLSWIIIIIIFAIHQILLWGFKLTDYSKFWISIHFDA